MNKTEETLSFVGLRINNIRQSHLCLCCRLESQLVLKVLNSSFRECRRIATFLEQRIGRNFPNVNIDKAKISVCEFVDDIDLKLT